MTSTQAKSTVKPHPQKLLMQVRTWHAYVGMLIAPTVLFMAITGFIQVYSLHEAHDGYTPPALIEKLGMVHKNQRFAQGRHAPPPAKASAAAKPAADEDEKPAARPPGGEPERSPIPIYLLKTFFAAVSIGLTFSTATGVWMALRQPLRRRTYLVLLLVGTLIPVILAAFTA